MTTQATESRQVTVACPMCDQLNRVDLARIADGPKCGSCGRPMRLDRPIRLTDATLDRVVQDASVPVVVDFYADWCAPCKVMAPVFDELARERAGSVLFAKVDTDRSPQVSMKFGVRNIPTLVVFNNGREVTRQVGAVPKPALARLLDGVAK